MEDIERLSKDANLAYYEMVNSNKHEPLTKVSGNYKLFTKEKDISTQTLQDKIRKYDFSNEISRWKISTSTRPCSQLKQAFLATAGFSCGKSWRVQFFSFLFWSQVLVHPATPCLSLLVFILLLFKQFKIQVKYFKPQLEDMYKRLDWSLIQHLLNMLKTMFRYPWKWPFRTST